MQTTFIVEWEVFQVKFLNEADIFVDDTVDSWIFYAVKGGIMVKSIKEKDENPEINMMFVNGLADRPNVTKFIAIEKEESQIEITPNPVTPVIDTTPSANGETNA